MICLALLLATGCSRGLPTTYGPSRGYTASRSINGFAALREGFIGAGFEDRDLNRLTTRARRSSVVVWTPSHPSGIGVKTTRWFDQWLRMGNKTLIYVIPDSGSEAEFYRQARPAATPAQRLEYRRKYAEQLIVEHQWHLRRTALPSNGWFDAVPKVQRSELSADPSATTSWTGMEDENTGNDSDLRRFEWVVSEHDPKNNQPTGTVIVQQAGPGSPSWDVGATSSVVRSDVAFEPLLKTDSGDTVVARISSDQWRDSQILVVAGGSLLTNFGLVRPANRQLAARLIEASKQPLIDGNVIDPNTGLLADGNEPQVAFSSAVGEMPISERQDAIPRASGAELLTVFPISLVTIHIAILGFVICLMLLPIFGRPRHVSRGDLTHFGDHLDAVATLMRRSGGENYARRRVSEYMRRVRGETSGPWVLPEPKHVSPVALTRPRHESAEPSKAAEPGPETSVQPGPEPRSPAVAQSDSAVASERPAEVPSNPKPNDPPFQSTEVER
ncbi:hypothetical protein FYK55_10920 [Roseiconus nitratireducens]|uniref:Uncharacterized protein n=1 Tax=Roseiconus nitratireducens TaxID=2605748 RepID=A0A5M6D820_9BACT|nr:hypothetical protein [Roseiconus nitratireducens]KAA5543698.1 hypothetical protein FYK55_10920 [Roseiconus nitratireducens]